MKSSIQVHYCLNCALLSLYGVQVCPFIETLSLFELLAPILLTFGMLYTIRLQLSTWLQSKDLHLRVKTQFKADLLLFALGGLILASYNFLVHDFPLGSGLKIILGMSVSGFFVACHLALGQEYEMVSELAESGQHIEFDQSPYPLTKKFCWFASICLCIMGVVILLVVVKDLSWLVSLDNDQNLMQAAMAISLEIAFVMLYILLYIFVIVSAYGANLKLMLHSQESTLYKVANGQLAERVPVVSNDEFGVIARHTNHTVEALQNLTDDLEQLRDVTILALTSLAETRDNETGEHILRTQHYVRILAEKLKHHKRFNTVLDSAAVELLYKTAPLHDVGKVGIPDAILLKPGPLSDEEFDVMKRHPLIGAHALKSAQSESGENSFLSMAREIIETHHEKWDGSGYPRGLQGENIPISGRLMALADVYDALTSERVYKAAFSHAKARDIIIDGKGSHFDPDVVDAFLELEDDFQAIARQYSKPTTMMKPAA